MTYRTIGKKYLLQQWQITTLHDIAPFIPGLDEGAGIEPLIGRYLITAHHVLDQRVGKE